MKRVKEYFVIYALSNKNEELYMYVDAHSGGYVGWTNTIDDAKHFDTLQEAKQYYNCSFNDSLISYQICGKTYIKKVAIEIQTDEDKIEEYISPKDEISACVTLAICTNYIG